MIQTLVQPILEHRARPACLARLSFRAAIALGPVLAIAMALPAQTAQPFPDLDPWLAHRTNLVAWSADVQQTRSLKSVARPLVTPGRVWFRTPNLFRWELGRPARTIAIREPDRLVLLYPMLKRAEIYPLTDSSQGLWRSSLTLLEAGFPSSRQQLESQFDIRALEERDGQLLVHLEPKSDLARRWVSRVDVTLGGPKLELVATELSFADGSRLRNEFSGASSEADPPDHFFRADIPPDYTVTQPVADP